MWQGHARDALHSHSANGKAWLILGEVLLAKQQHEAAEECLQAADKLSKCSPVLPFGCLPTSFEL